MQNTQPHTQVKFEDLSGPSTGTYANPYDALIEGSNNDLSTIQARYSTHRTVRNAQQKEKILDPAFTGVLIDSILKRLHDPNVEPGFQDPRHCLVLWARPPQQVRGVLHQVQQRLLAVAPNLWTMPQDNLHMTALEITHSKTQEEIDVLVEQFKPQLPELLKYTRTRRPRLHSPLLSYDAQGLALSFLPANGESLPQGRTADEDAYTYHHFRRDIFARVSAVGLPVDSRYVVPSAHLTVARFIEPADFMNGEGKVDHEKLRQFMDVVEETNAWLEREWWPRDGREGLQWIVGEEKGLDCREGRLWYGDGTTVMRGEGF